MSNQRSDPADNGKTTNLKCITQVPRHDEAPVLCI